jgi:hypothetical protein
MKRNAASGLFTKPSLLIDNGADFHKMGPEKQRGSPQGFFPNFSPGSIENFP